MLAALGVDVSSPAGWWSLAVFITIACLFVGFLTDTILRGAGYGIVGNGFIVIVGVCMTVYGLDRRLFGVPVVTAASGVSLAAACGTALLLFMAAIKRRID